MFFGKDENIRCIESIPRFEVTDINGNPQTVCYAAKVTTNSFIVPYRTYVDLCNKKKEKDFFHLFSFYEKSYKSNPSI